jgi:hypothetical protein
MRKNGTKKKILEKRKKEEKRGEVKCQLLVIFQANAVILKVKSIPCKQIMFSKTKLFIRTGLFENYKMYYFTLSSTKYKRQEK